MALTAKPLYSPTALITYLQSPFCAWMERAHRLAPEQYVPDPVDDETQLLFDKGNQHEQGYIDHLKAAGHQVVEIDGVSDEAKRQATLAAMQEGVEVIVQAELAHPPFRGRADFLFRVDNEPSDLGNYHYIVGDTKLSKHAKATHVMQLCVYAELLEHIQGIRPQWIDVIVKDFSHQRFDLKSIWYAYQQVRQDFLAFQEGFDLNNMPEPQPGEQWGRWTSAAEAYFEQTDHLIRVANITQSQIKKLRAAGIHALTDLANTPATHIPKLAKETLETLKAQASVQQATQQSGKPEYRVKPHNGQRRGLAALPPASTNDIYFDIEGNPFVDGGLEYLFGVTTLGDDGSLAFQDWWAHNRAEEKQLLEDFIDWVMARFQADPTLHIFHYANYEIAALRKLMGRYGTREAEIDHLLRHEVFVDLYRVVVQGLIVGMPSYSIKDIEQVFRGKRAGNVQSGGASIVVYEDWCAQPDGITWETSAKLKSIRDYNQEDTDSTYYVTEWLREIQSDQGIAYVPPQPKDNLTIELPEAHVDAVLSNRLIEGISEEVLTQPPAQQPADVRVRVLLANLVEFYRREDKPFWWSYFDRKTLTHDELMDDADCIGACQRTDTPPVPEKNSYLYEFAFDPKQEFKCREGDSVALIWDGDKEHVGTLETLDKRMGRLTIKATDRKATGTGLNDLDAGKPVSVIPYDIQRAKALHDALAETITTFAETGKLRGCLNDFLYRTPPNIHGLPSGQTIIDPRQDLTAQAVALAESLGETCLCIQGPPGTGKSYTGSRMILAWLKAGKRVGIASNSHKAINNLMTKVLEVAQEEGFRFSGCKANGKTESDWEGTCIQQVKSGNDVAPSHQLVGGTAWCFASDNLKDALDILVIDEAGQVSLANVVAMSRSTKTIVLLGDQMQLPQPLQGSHPGESGLSALEYYLQDHATIPPEQGIFLNVTRRCSPEITEFISDLAYDGRLTCHDSTRYWEIHHGNNTPILAQLGKPAGIRFIPVEHEGNTQASDEEVQIIQQLVSELKDHGYQNHKQEQDVLTLKDILIVAPYNQQVLALQEALGPDARVGTVDKFQGQEAPVVIVSLCASNPQDSPRGMEFLLSKHRLNVALSRAQALAIVVGSPNIAKAPCSSIEQLQLVNPFARLIRNEKQKSIYID